MKTVIALTVSITMFLAACASPKPSCVADEDHYLEHCVLQLDGTGGNTSEE